MNYTREENDIWAVDGEERERVGFIDEDGSLKMLRGMAKSHREGVERFLEESGETEEPEPEEKDDGTVPPCPPEDPMAGDKTPAVVAWMFRYHPEEAAKRYENRKFTNPDTER